MIPFDYKIHHDIATSYSFNNFEDAFLFAFSENNFKKLIISITYRQHCQRTKYLIGK
jgi:hypothetical protein